MVVVEPRDRMLVAVHRRAHNAGSHLPQQAVPRVVAVGLGIELVAAVGVDA